MDFYDSPSLQNGGNSQRVRSGGSCSIKRKLHKKKSCEKKNVVLKFGGIS